MKVSLGSYHSQPIANFSRNLISLCLEEQFSSTVEDNTIFSRIKTDSEQYQKRIILPTYSGKGAKQRELHQKRSRLYSSLKQTLLGLSKTEGELSPLAKDVLSRFPRKEKFSGNLNYAEKSEQIEQTLKALTVASLNATLAKLNVLSTVNLLKDTQAEFQQHYLEQIKANAELRSLPKPDELRKKLIKSIQDFYQYAELMQAETGWKDLYPEMVQLYVALKQSKHHSEEHNLEGKDKEEKAGTENLPKEKDQADKSASLSESDSHSAQ